MSDGRHISEKLKREPLDHGHVSPLASSSQSTQFCSNADMEQRRPQMMGDSSHIQLGVSSRVLEESGSHQSHGDRRAARKKVSLRSRISCFTWTWFAMTMATGGMANVLHSVPYRTDKNWINSIGVAFMLLNISLFCMNCLLISLRFKVDHGSFSRSFTDQQESLFVGTFFVSIGTILTNICQYGISSSGVWLQNTMMVLFWIYAGVSMLASSGLYLVIWSTQQFPLNTMTPLWVMPAYPLLLAAPFASNLIDALPDRAAAESVNSVCITLGAVTLQGTGFIISIMIYAAFLYRLMTHKLPKESLRPGIFISVGPAGFTVAGLVHLGNLAATKVFPNGFMGNMNASFVLKVIADLVGLWLWGLCIWFFLISIGSHYPMILRKQGRQFSFAMNWFSFIFPNTALVTATQQIGRAFDIVGVQILGTVMSVLLVAVWIGVFGAMLRALFRKRILWPQDEEHEV